MSTQAPSAGRILTMVAFAASCVGLLLFLWISFGGATPLAPQGYRLTAEFNQAVELGAQSDVRISGVNVGKVVSVNLDHRTGLTRAVMELDSTYAPRPADTRAILRSKTLLGETFIELSPGSRMAPKLPDGGALPPGQIAPSVQLDQILSTFDPVTRQAFKTWQQQDAIALTNRGQEFNAAVAQLFPFARNVDAVLAVLNRDSAATTTLLRDGGQVFSALSRSPAQLQGLVRNSNAVFAATAAQDTALANTIRAFPAFLVATRLTIDRVDRFAATTKPLVDELRPAAVQLSPALESTAVLAPELRSLLVNVGPLTAASKAGVPAFERFLDDTVPLLGRLTPYLGGLVPVIDYINVYRREIAGFFANSTAASQGTQSGISTSKLLHYALISNPVNPEVLTVYQRRLSSNRANPYLTPGGYNLLSGLPVFGSYLCTNNPQPTFGAPLYAQQTQITSGSKLQTISVAQLLQTYYYTANPAGPPCKGQATLGPATTGQLQAFPHLTPLP
jgi:phospholipid/cholesterol/gamma-HCH transport system substrate-binding protein